MSEAFSLENLDEIIGRPVKVEPTDIFYTHHGKKRKLGVWIEISGNPVLAYIDQIDQNGYAHIQAYTTYSEMISHAMHPLAIVFA